MSAGASAQANATDPRVSAWVSANAGSGKTYVLTRRVVRLLLAGTDPGRILCLTFTRAAAAEMATRVFGVLAGWTRMDDATLAAEIAELEGRPPTGERMVRARRLFANALDTPGGLKIQTIHAFCERLLHQFPFEANVPGSFEVMEEVEADALLGEARRRVLARAGRDPDSPCGRALSTALAYASDFIHETSVVEIVAKRDTLRLWTDLHGSLDAALEALRAEFGLAPDETPAALRDRILAEAALDAAARRQLADRLRSGGKRDGAAADRLAPAIEADDPAERADGYRRFFLKADGAPYSLAYLASKAVCAGWPGLADTLAAEGERLAALFDRIRLAECLESSAAMFRLADSAMDDYETLKRRRGVLDFEDLVVRTVSLLGRAGASAWVHYKLDRGLDHILVDEAQDTSPRQWQVVRALTEEFFAGEGAAEAGRTVFAVGDEKQSIYSFQGAVPTWFGQVRGEFRSVARDGGYGWHDVPLVTSYRSVPAVLEAVDRVFAGEDVHRGVTFDRAPTVHEANRRNQPGRVTIWPVFEPPDEPAPRDWATPLDRLGRESPENRLARRIAETIAGWLERGETLEATGRPIAAGDILILTRTRGALSDAVNRQLKRRGVDIAGVDRLALTEHIAVMDLLALGRVILLPQDDLSLAVVLKSPLIGFDDDRLFALAHDRQGSLWQALNRAAGTDPVCADAAGRIRGWMADADRGSPHGFYARLVASDRGRRAFLGRLGPECDDVLDEFLSLALAYERAEIPSLEGFVAWLTDADVKVKRDADTGRAEVRVMTVHGAKGLEAPVVFLLDNGSQPHHATHDPRLLALGDDADALAPRGLVWNRGRPVLPAAVQAVLEARRERAREEYRRLLYVGMTRACDRLYVCGIAKKAGSRPDGWHALVTRALAADCEPDAEVADALVWRSGGDARKAAEDAAAGSAAVPERPAWLDRPAPPAPAPVVRVSPSTMVEPPPASGIAGSAVDDGGVAPLDRGRVVHRLLQSLPDRPPEERRDLARRYLDHAAHDWPDAARVRTVEEVMAVLETGAFAAAFAPGSRAEVDIAGRVGTRLVSGRIDRLAVADDRVLVVDFKTNRAVPETPADIPRGYVVQLAWYRRLLADIYPGRPIETALLWTALPKLTVVPEDVMAAVTASDDR